MIASLDNMVYYSVASLWEIALKNQKDPRRCPYDEKTLMTYCEMSGYLPLDIRPEHILSVRHLRVRDGHYLGNLDPFDRLLLAQARTENCLFLTHDSNMAHYDENCIMMT